MEKTHKFKELSIKALAVFGLLALMALGSFATITALTYVPNAYRFLSGAVSLSSIFKPAEELSVTAESYSVNSGDPVTLSFTHRGKKVDGSYTLFYPCVDGVSITASTTQGMEQVYCNTAFHFVNTDNTLPLKLSSTNTRYTDVAVSVEFTPNGEKDATLQNAANFTITNASKDSGNFVITPATTTETEIAVKPTPTPVKPTHVSSPTPAPVTHSTTPVAGTPTQQNYTIPVNGGVSSNASTSNPNGKADLRPTILEIGYINRLTNTFTAVTATSSTSTPEIHRSERVAVRFEVENLGNKASGSWQFNAILPTIPPHTFNSDSQPSLNPGDKIEFTLGFDQTMEGTDTITIKVDGPNQIIESNEDNNTAATTFRGI